MVTIDLQYSRYTAGQVFMTVSFFSSVASPNKVDNQATKEDQGGVSVMATTRRLLFALYRDGGNREIRVTESANNVLSTAFKLVSPPPPR